MNFVECVVTIFLASVVHGEMNNDIVARISTTENFKAYWNVPSFQCDYHKLNFSGLCDKYGIIQNEDARFRGDEFVILYDPGDFPAILKGDFNRIYLRNGGIPQEGNLTLHLEIFKDTIEELIPNENFSGIAVIDFESWRPVYRQNFGSLQPYKDLSMEREKQEHPFWPTILLEKSAITKFEFAARMFMEETLIYAKQLRPEASWGYYAYPYCFNMSPKNKHTQCPNEVTKENDRIDWLFLESDNLYPSLYLSERTLKPEERLQLIEGRINEAHRIVGYINKNYAPKILPYFWYKYQDTKQFVSVDDLRGALLEIKSSNVDGFVLWGSSDDVNNKKKCFDLFNYIDTILGPILIST